MKLFCGTDDMSVLVSVERGNGEEGEESRVKELNWWDTLSTTLGVIRFLQNFE